MSRRWVRMGHKVSVVCGIPNHPAGQVYPGYEGRGFVHEVIEGIDVYRTWVFVAANAGTIRRSLNYISFGISAVLTSASLHRVDVCIASSPQFLVGLAGTVVARILGVPLVLEIRDLWPDSIRAVEAIRSERTLSVLTRLERHMYASAGRIVIVSPAFQNHIESCGINQDRISVVTNGIDSAMFADRPAVRTVFNGELRDKFIALYAGTIGMAHGLESILEAAELLRDKPNIHFVIAGDGARRSTLEKTAEGLDNVTMMGQRRREEIAAMWKEADVGLVLLRSAELFKTVIPSKMFEVMASGAPLVLGVEGQAKEILDTADAGTAIEPQNARALAAAVLRYCNDPELRRLHGGNGAEYVNSHYDLDVLAGRYMDVLEEAAK